MTMTIFRIPSFSYNRASFEETATDIICSLNKDNKNINIYIPLGAGKTILLAEIVAFCVRNCLFERITYFAPSFVQCVNFSDIVEKKLQDEDISYVRNKQKIIKTEYSDIVSLSFAATLGGMQEYKSDLLLIDEDDNLSAASYKGILPLSYNSKGVITTSNSGFFNHFPSKDHNK